jgi:hypothetical protein
MQHMQQMMDGGMMWGMGLGGLIILVLVVLAIVALVKYTFFRCWPISARSRWRASRRIGQDSCRCKPGHPHDLSRVALGGVRPLFAAGRALAV